MKIIFERQVILNEVIHSKDAVANILSEASRGFGAASLAGGEASTAPQLWSEMPDRLKVKRHAPIEQKH